MFAEQLLIAITVSSNIAVLDNNARLTWRSLSEGLIDDRMAESLSVAIEARRSALQGAGSPISKKPTMTRHRPCRSPEKLRSIERRRGLAASGAVPGKIAAHFTTGEIAALTVVARECQRTGSCDWFMDRIAAVAGVSRTTARNALRQAQRLGLITRQERRLTAWRSESNIIKIVSGEWLLWLGIGGGRKKQLTTNNSFKNNSISSGETSKKLAKFRFRSRGEPSFLVHSRHDHTPRDCSPSDNS